MPKIREYKSQATPSVLITTRKATAADFGGGIGKVLAKAGEQAGDLAEKMQKSKERSEALGVYADVASAREQIVNDLRESSDSGATLDPNFNKDFNTRLQEKAAEITGKTTTRKAREVAAVVTARMGADARTRAGEVVSDDTARRAVSDFVKTRDINRNVLLTDPSLLPVMLEEAELNLGDPDGPYGAASEQKRRELLDQTQSEYALTAIQGAARIDEALALEQVESGQFDAYLKPEMKNNVIERLTREVKQKAAKVADETKFKIIAELQDKANLGDLSDTEIANSIKAKILTPSGGLSLRGLNTRRKQEIERAAELDVRISEGSPVGLLLFGKAEQQEGFDRYVSGLFVAAGEDASAKQAALSRVIERGRELGMVPSVTRSQLTRATVARPQEFDVAAKMYESFRAIDPAYANAQVSTEQAARFDVYLTTIEAGGNEQAAIEQARLAGDPKRRAEAEKVLNSVEGREALQGIDDEISVIDNFGFWNDEAISNPQLARKKITDFARLRIAQGDASPEQAVEWARDQFLSRYKVVGDRWLFLPGDVAPAEGLADSLEAFLTRVPDALASDGAMKDDIDPDGYELRSDRQTKKDSSLQVYSRSTGMPVAGLRIKPRDALDAWNQIKDREAAEDAQKAFVDRRGEDVYSPVDALGG